MTDQSRAFVGLATILGEPPMNWTAAAFRPWVQLEQTLPVMVGHDVVISSSGVTKEIGRITDAALIGRGSTPPALLVRGYFDPGAPGDVVLEGVRDYRPGQPSWALSLAASVYADDDGDPELVIPTEVSVTLDPVYPDALILGVAERAAAVWDLLAPPSKPRTRQPW